MHEDSDERQQVRRALAQFWARERVPERIVEQTVDIAASAIPVPPITEEDIAEVGQGIPPDRVRPQRRGLRESPDAGDDDTLMSPRNLRLPVPAEEPRPMLKPAPPTYQPDEDSTSTLGRGPVGPSRTGSTKETLSASPHVLSEILAEAMC